MSKMDDLRAMREARYEQARATKPASPPKRAAPPPAGTKRPPVASTPPASAPPAEALCGHRSISGRTCTREHGHTAKSHRYS